MRASLFSALLLPAFIIACSDSTSPTTNDTTNPETEKDDAGGQTSPADGKDDAGTLPSDARKPDMGVGTPLGSPKDAHTDEKVDGASDGHIGGDGETTSPAGLSVELEDGTITDATVDTTEAGYTGTGYVAFQGKGKITVELNVPKGELYSIMIRSLVPTASGDKTNDLEIDGKPAGNFVSKATGEWLDTTAVAKTFLTEGRHTISILKNWGWTNFDSLRLVAAARNEAPKVDPTPVNAAATDEAKRVLKFLADHFGQNIVSGQQDLTWQDSVDMIDRVFKLTGKKPALMGFDLMNYTNTSGAGLKQVEEALAWWKQGGLVAFTWHWRVGTEEQFYTKDTTFRIDMDPSSAAYKAMVEDIDAIAADLKPLADAKVPILFRPLHEASGGWFWWGASGAKPYIELYRFMFDRLTKEHHLDNLIWVWNGQDAAWYPGNEYVDVIGIDHYANPGDHSSQVTRFESALQWAEGGETKLVALTENGPIPDPTLLQQDGAWWSWFMTWNDGNSDSENFFSSERFTSSAKKKEIFAHEYVLTLDELPDLKTYPLE